MMWFLVGLMMIVALLMVLSPLRKSATALITVDSNTANVAILKEQLSELEAEFANGNMTESLYDNARMELEASVAADLTDEVMQKQVGLTFQTRMGLVGLLTLFLVVGSLMSYQRLTTYEDTPAITGQPSSSITEVVNAGEQAPPLGEMAEVLEARLRQNPEDARGWFMMGKTYMLLDRVEDAVGAYDTAYKIVGDTDTDLLADYAEALAYANGDSMLGRPSELVNQALQLDPAHAKSLWLAGFAAMQNEAYVAAINHWRALLAIQGIPEHTRQLAEQYISEAHDLAGLLEDQPIVPVDAGPAGSDAVATLSIKVQVSLDDALKGKVSVDEIVYVFAKASTGMPLPLAVKRLTVADLPATVILDDSMAMLKGNNLSGHAEVIVGARVSRDGTPIARAGDLQGLGNSINPREISSQTIIINQIVN